MEAVMESIEEHFVEFSDVYVNVMILIQTIITALLLIYWLKPFVIRKRAAYAAAGLYLLYFIPNIFIDTTGIIWRIILWIVMVAIILVVWFLDDKINLIQKIYLLIVFRLIWFIAVEIFSELGFYERDIVFSFDIFRSSITAIVLEFIIWNLIYYGGAMLLLYVAIKILHKTYKTKSENLTWQEFVMLFVPSCSFLAVKPIMASYMRLWMDGIASGSIQENIPGDIYRVIFDILALVSIIILIAFL